MIYISPFEEANSDVILWRIKSKQIATISTIKGFKEMGGMIEILEVNNKLRFRFNIGVAKDANISINSDLINMGLD